MYGKSPCLNFGPGMLRMRFYFLQPRPSSYHIRVKSSYHKAPGEGQGCFVPGSERAQIKIGRLCTLMRRIFGPKAGILFGVVLSG
jgi:hypothetical protein